MEMGGLAEGMLGDAVATLMDGDLDRVASLDDREDRVNALQIELDEKAVALTVQQQPVARDVRAIFVASRCAADVERAADQAINIRNSVRHHFDGREQATPPAELEAMAMEARKSFTNALTAIVTNDTDLAQRVLLHEPIINDLRDGVFKEVLYTMITRPASASSALSLLLISRNLERVGDLATNIAEELVYLVEGRDIRHGNDVE